MEGIKVLRSTQIIILGICFVVATITSTVILSKGLLAIKKFSGQVITVTGSTEKNITSDLMVWKLSFSRREAKMVAAFGLLKDDLRTVKDYLAGKGIKENEVIAAPVTTTVLHKKNEKGNDTNDIEGYILGQRLRSAQKMSLRLPKFPGRRPSLSKRGWK